MPTERIILARRILTFGSCLLLAACGDSSGDASGDSAAGISPAPSVDTSPPAPAAMPASSGARAGSAPASAPGSTLLTRSVAPFGTVLTDGRGRTLYLLEEDRGGESRCVEMCAVIWPPFLGSAAALPAAGDSLVRAALIGSRPRAGGVQVTYGGHPLYYYLGDREPGEALGHHVEDSWGEWAAVTPGGRQVEGDRVGDSGRGRRGRGRDDD